MRIRKTLCELVSPESGSDCKAAEIICAPAAFRRHQVTQAAIHLARRLLHLLAKEMEGAKALLTRFIGVDLNVVADRIRRPKSVDSARGQQLLRDDSIKQLLRIIEQLARLRADYRIFENRG